MTGEKNDFADLRNWANLLVAPPPAKPAKPAHLPSLSVLVGVYNAAETIGEALESVLTQKPEPLEVIVSDDGSDDDLESALFRFGDRVRLLRGPNRGVAVARNRAAAAARGELLGLLDADDVRLPGRAAAFMAAAAARPDLSIFTTDAIIIRDGIRDDQTYYDVREFDVERQDLAILRSNFIFGPGAVRRQALAEVGGCDPTARRAVDWSLWLRLVLRGHQAGLIRAALYEYRRGPGSLTASKVDLALGCLTVLDRAEQLLSRDDQAEVMAQTKREWRLRAVHNARLMHDARERPLALAALGSAGHSLRERARLLAHCLVPSRPWPRRSGPRVDVRPHE